jgi:hypothetical protein
MSPVVEVILPMTLAPLIILLASDFEGGFEVAVLNEFPETGRAGHVGPFPDHEEALSGVVVGFQFRKGGAGVGFWVCRTSVLAEGWNFSRCFAFDGFGDGGDVFGKGIHRRG